MKKPCGFIEDVVNVSLKIFFIKRPCRFNEDVVDVNWETFVIKILVGREVEVDVSLRNIFHEKTL